MRCVRGTEEVWEDSEDSDSEVEESETVKASRWFLEELEKRYYAGRNREEKPEAILSALPCLTCSALAPTRPGRGQINKEGGIPWEGGTLPEEVPGILVRGI